MKIFKRVLSVIICLILVLGTVAAGGCFSRLSDTFSIRATAGASCSTGNIIEYGSYPQSEVKEQCKPDAGLL